MKLSELSSLKSKKDDFFLMTRIVAGYPDFDTNEEVIENMVAIGIKIIEIQIPFSDPITDGAIIVRANQVSLERGTSIEDCFKFMEKMSARFPSIFLLFMTYSHIPYIYGFENFIKKSAAVGISGFIIPDLPYDEDTKIFNTICQKIDLPNIRIVSPDISLSRLETISEIAHGFVCITSKTGITETQREFDPAIPKYISNVREKISLPLAARFGLSKPEHLRQLKGIADIAIIDSKLIELQEKKGVKGIVDFIKKLVQYLK